MGKRPFKPKGRFGQNKNTTPEYSEAQKPAKEIFPMRLNKYISNSGVCSRREADKLIEQGEVTVNDKVVKEMGFQVDAQAVVKYNGKVLKPEKLVYVLLNKPKGFITTTSDPDGRKTVMDLIKNACEEQIFPVGRLDRTTTGLLLFTNDGDLAKKLTHPGGNIKKIYQATLDKPLTKNDFTTIVEGFQLDDGPVVVDDLAFLNDDKTEIGIEIHMGKNRIVRRIFEHFGYQVEKLDRAVFAGLTKKDLSRGRWRFLSEKELRGLK